MKRLFVILMALLFVSASGCATKEDLDRFYLTLDKRIEEVNRDLSRVKKDFNRFKEEDYSKLEGKTSSNLSEIKGLQESVAKNIEFNKSIRGNQAGFGEDVNDLRSEVRNLRGAVEELKMEVTTLRARPKGRVESKELNETLNDITVRLSYLKQYLEVGKKEAVKKESEGDKVSPQEKVDKEKAYSEAYKAFKNGEYSRARKEFEEFLKSFSDTEYSDNAQFWIGECYYFEGKYEKAILEYEKVIKNYPKGNKVPNALLKQAISFFKIEDKASAKLLLQRVIKDYPGTTTARIARQSLVDIK